MKFLRFLVQIVIHLLLALIALNAILSGLWRFGDNPLQRFFTDHILPAQILARDDVWRFLWLAVLLLVVLYWVATLAIWRRRPRALNVRATGGESILIHPGALLKFTRLQVENHPAVVSQKVRVRQRGSRGLSVWVSANVRPIESLPTIKHQLEEQIREGFAQVLGIEKVDEITIIIGLDEKSLSSRPGPLVKAEPQPEPPVRGTLGSEDYHDENSL